MNKLSIFEAVAKLSDALTTTLPKPMMASVTYTEQNSNPYSIEITIWPDEILKSKSSIKYLGYYFERGSSVEFVTACIVEQQRKVLAFVNDLLNGQEGEQ